MDAGVCVYTYASLFPSPTIFCSLVFLADRFPRSRFAAFSSLCQTSRGRILRSSSQAKIFHDLIASVLPRLFCCHRPLHNLSFLYSILIIAAYRRAGILREIENSRDYTSRKLTTQAVLLVDLLLNIQLEKEELERNRRKKKRGREFGRCQRDPFPR